MTLPSGLRLDIEDEPANADVEVLPDGLEAFNESRWPRHQPWKPLAVFVRIGKGSSLPALLEKPTPAGSSSNIFGCPRGCGAAVSDAS